MTTKSINNKDFYKYVGNNSTAINLVLSSNKLQKSRNR